MNRKALITFLASSIILTNILFFMDEGYYDFRWMKDPGNWIAFLIYSIPVFLMQLLFFHILLKKYTSSGKILLSLLGGVLSGLILVLGFFYLILK